MHWKFCSIFWARSTVFALRDKDLSMLRPLLHFCRKNHSNPLWSKRNRVEHAMEVFEDKKESKILLFVVTG